MNVDWTNAFYTQLSQLTILRPKVLLLGDFNSDLLVSSDFSDEILRSFDLQQLVKTPTRITEFTATLLDHIYVPKNLAIYAGTTNLYIADHYATYCCIHASEHCTSTNYQHLVVQHRSCKIARSITVKKTRLVKCSFFMKLAIHRTKAFWRNVQYCTGIGKIKQFVHLWPRSTPT